MRIGELAGQAGCPVETIRYYERIGLLPRPKRSQGNYRVYDARHAEQLAFVRRCRSLDMSLPEIRTLLNAIETPEADCQPVNALLDEHIGHVAARIAELRQLKAELDGIRTHCQGHTPTKHCGIVSVLAHAATPTSPLSRHVRGTHGNRVR